MCASETHVVHIRYGANSRLHVCACMSCVTQNRTHTYAHMDCNADMVCYRYQVMSQPMPPMPRTGREFVPYFQPARATSIAPQVLHKCERMHVRECVHACICASVSSSGVNTLLASSFPSLR